MGPHNMLRIQGAVILVLSVLVAVNGLKCYKSCTGSGCTSSDGTATDTAITCPLKDEAGDTINVCLKETANSGFKKECGAELDCLGREIVMGVLVTELEKAGADAKTVAEAKSYKCYECAGDLCN